MLMNKQEWHLYFHCDEVLLFGLQDAEEVFSALKLLDRFLVQALHAAVGVECIQNRLALGSRLCKPQTQAASADGPFVII